MVCVGRAVMCHVGSMLMYVYKQTWHTGQYISVHRMKYLSTKNLHSKAVQNCANYSSSTSLFYFAKNEF